ncbi:MAG: hypothetical protein K2G80_01770, partial [Bacteroidales bacterium]|nr:hypothetical protein [Bacteroidales bacterium]
MAGSLCARADVADSLMRAGDSLHCAYRFDHAIDAYGQALLQVGQGELQDSSVLFALNDRILMSENGKNMARFA